MVWCTESSWMMMQLDKRLLWINLSKSAPKKGFLAKLSPCYALMARHLAMLALFAALIPSLST
jgi:hypothetical protein